MSTAIVLGHARHQTISPQLQQAVRLLQLSSVDFEQEMRLAMSRNPFLEEQEPSVEEADSEPAEPAIAGGADLHDDLNRDADWVAEAGKTTKPSTGIPADDDFDPCSLIEAAVSLRQHLHLQLSLMQLGDRQRRIVGTLIEACDNDGYLRLSLEEVMPLVALEETPGVAEMQAMLGVLQSFDPKGVGARNLRECLLLQVDGITNEYLREHTRTTVSDHLNLVAKQDVQGLAKVLGARPGSIELIFKAVRRFDPRPGLCFGASELIYVEPDILVARRQGKWRAALNSQAMPKVRLNQMYARLFQGHRDATHSPMGAYLQEARWTLRNIEQRFSTILSVSNAIVKRQEQFFEHGPFAMKPLRLAEIADEIGVHESTVSRATTNKFMSTPSGVYELKYFFSRSVAQSSRGAFSATAIREVIRELICTEDREHPLTDVEIAKRLARQGFVLTRRTVTKYRQQLRMPSYELRGRSGPATTDH